MFIHICNICIYNLHMFSTIFETYGQKMHLACYFVLRIATYNKEQQLRLSRLRMEVAGLKRRGASLAALNEAAELGDVQKAEALFSVSRCDVLGCFGRPWPWTLCLVLFVFDSLETVGSASRRFRC